MTLVGTSGGSRRDGPDGESGASGLFTRAIVGFRGRRVNETRSAATRRGIALPVPLFEDCGQLGTVDLVK